jgi:DNA-binding HxlR family transcriptional regulator
LANRLAKLEAEGLVTRTIDPNSARQRVYTLTARGLDLAPVLVEMILWSAKHDPDSAVDKRFVRDAQHDKNRLLSAIAKAARG